MFPAPVWWVDAEGCHVSVIGTGATAGDGTVDSELALVLSGDSSYAIEGTRAEVLAFLDRAASAVDAHPQQDAKVAVWFTPDAIRDHFADDDLSPQGHWVAAATDEQLRRVGEACVSADPLWSLFLELLVEETSHAMGEEADAKQLRKHGDAG